jgi:hypothetical protein
LRAQKLGFLGLAVFRAAGAAFLDFAQINRAEAERAASGSGALQIARSKIALRTSLQPSDTYKQKTHQAKSLRA